MSEVEQYEAEAAQTRERLRTSVEEMQRRLTPANIIQNARDSVRETVSTTVRDSSDAAVAQVRRAMSTNPVVLAAIGAVLVFIIYKRMANRRRVPSGVYADGDEYAAYGEGDSYVGDRSERTGPLARGWTNVRTGVSSAGERLGAAGDRVRSTLDSARGSVGHAAGGIASRAGDNLRNASRAATDAANDAGQAAKRVVAEGSELARENPMVVVGIGLAAGALVALLSGDDSSERWDDEDDEAYRV